MAERFGDSAFAASRFRRGFSQQFTTACCNDAASGPAMLEVPDNASSSISGLVVEYIVAIDVTRVRFPADAFSWFKNLEHMIAKCGDGISQHVYTIPAGGMAPTPLIVRMVDGAVEFGSPGSGVVS